MSTKAKTSPSPGIVETTVSPLPPKCLGAVCVARGRSMKKIFTNMTANFPSLPALAETGIP